MEPHEYASIFPMLPEAELQQLAADIKLNGLNNPIIKLDGKILDGRNRYAACKIAGIRPIFDEYQGDDPLAFVFSQNFTRRQLTESQKGMIGARYATLEHGANQHRQETSRDASKTVGQSIAEAAERVGVGTSTIDRAKAVINKGVPELVAAVEAGEVTVKAAAAVAKLPDHEQRAAVAAGPEAVKEAAKTVTAPASQPPPPQEPKPATKRLPPAQLSNAGEIAVMAMLTLDRINKNDKTREAALQDVINYCETRIKNNQ